MKSKVKNLKKTKTLKPVKIVIANQINKLDIIKYQKWLRQNSISQEELLKQKEEAKEFSYKPLISIVVPTYNTPENFFNEMISSVFSQTYSNWEMILVDDASPEKRTRDLIESYSKNEKRIKPLILEKNHHIAEATNRGIDLAKGEFISLLDHDDVLLPNALFEVVKAINEQKNLDFIYTDEDKMTKDGRTRMQPFFKPDWNPDLLNSINYITHFTTIRKSLLNKTGYEDGKYNGAQDWELFLRVTRSIDKRKIHHIPQILYSWRVHDQSTAKSLEIKPYILESQTNALIDDLRQRGSKNFNLAQDELYSAQWQVQFKPLTKPKVSIIVTNPLVAKQVAVQVHQNTKYKNYDIEVMDPFCTYEDILLGKADDYVVFIDRKLKITDPNWLENMLGDAERPEIGFVLARVRTDESMENASKIINESAKQLLHRMSRLGYSRHVYRTTRYNLELFNGGVSMVEAKKLSKSLKGNLNTRFNLSEASKILSNSNFFNLYNPYIKMVI